MVQQGGQMWLPLSPGADRAAAAGKEAAELQIAESKEMQGLKPNIFLLN
jgi:hypothetical protein